MGAGYQCPQHLGAECVTSDKGVITCPKCSWTAQVAVSNGLLGATPTLTVHGLKNALIDLENQGKEDWPVACDNQLTPVAITVGGFVESGKKVNIVTIP